MRGWPWIPLFAMSVLLDSCDDPGSRWHDLGIRPALVEDFSCPQIIARSDTLVVSGYARVVGADKTEFSHIDAEPVAEGVDLRIFLQGWEWAGESAMPPTELGSEFMWKGAPPWSSDSIRVTIVQPNGTREACIVELLD